MDILNETHFWSGILNQCCGSVTFCFGSRSGSADPYHWLTDLAPARDPAFFVNDWEIFWSTITFPSVFIDKMSKRSYNKVEIKVFLTYFACLKHLDPNQYKIMMNLDPDQGVLNTYGSRSTTLSWTMFNVIGLWLLNPAKGGRLFIK